VANVLSGKRPADGGFADQEGAPKKPRTGASAATSVGNDVHRPLGGTAGLQASAGTTSAGAVAPGAAQLPPSISAAGANDDILRQLLSAQQQNRVPAPAAFNAVLNEHAMLAQLRLLQQQRQQQQQQAAQLLSSLAARQNAMQGTSPQQQQHALNLAMLLQMQGRSDAALRPYATSPPAAWPGLGFATNPLSLPGGGFAGAAQLLGSALPPGSADSDITSALRRGFQHSASNASSSSGVARQVSQTNTSTTSSSMALSEFSVPSVQRTLALPPCEEKPIPPPQGRPYYPLGIDEDPNWLSEFHCFVRLELIEVFRASHEDCKSRNNSIAYHQVGIRCRYCAHIAASSRAGRSSAFPSSLGQIYQSFTMMLRDHFKNCEAIHSNVRDRFMALKEKPSQGATDSKRFWVYSAEKLGLTDSTKGIIINESTRAAAERLPPFGTVPGRVWEDPAKAPLIVLPSDRPLVSEFLFLLMSQAQPIRLLEAERIGNRRSLKVGLPGFGCRHCYANRRLGLCRMFPARRRTLPGKANDLYDHIRRCTVCPPAIKEQLQRTHHQLNRGFHSDQGGDREFFNRIWSRLGHTASQPQSEDT